MGQTEELKSAVSQVGVDLGEAVSRVEAKIAALGEPDPDLSAEIANLRRFSEQLDSLAAEAPAPEPEPAPEPAPEPGEGGDVPPGPLGGRRR